MSFQSNQFDGPYKIQFFHLHKISDSECWMGKSCVLELKYKWFFMYLQIVINKLLHANLTIIFQIHQIT